MIGSLFKGMATLAALVCVSSAQAQANGPEIPPDNEVPIALLVDVTSGQVLHARDADRRFVPASITKVMTLYSAFELIEAGELDPDATMTMDDQTWREWNGQGSTMWINAGDAVRVSDLLTGIANISANDAAIMLARGQAGSVRNWVAKMNQNARSLQMTNSHFGTPNGWPDEGATFTTAHDLVRVAEALLSRHPDQYARYIGKPGFEYGGIEQFNYDPMIGRIRGADGIKTGYTNESGFGYLGSAERDGQRLVLVIAGARSNSIRARAARGYIEWGFNSFDREHLFDEGERIGSVRVQGGTSRSVAVRSDRTVFFNAPTGQSGQVHLSIQYDGPVRAPIDAGDRLATLVIEVPDMEPARVPLFAEHDVAEAGLLGRIFNAFAEWLS